MSTRGVRPDGIDSGPFHEPKQQRSAADLAGVVDVDTDHPTSSPRNAAYSLIAVILASKERPPIERQLPAPTLRRDHDVSVGMSLSAVGQRHQAR